jgi:hypothetical protein
MASTGAAITAATLTPNGGTAQTMTTGFSSPNYTATYTVNSSDPNGLVSFSITLTDSLGNSLTVPITAVTDTSSVLIDNTPPTVMVASFGYSTSISGPWTPIDGSTANTDLPNGDYLQLQFTVSDSTDGASESGVDTSSLSVAIDGKTPTSGPTLNAGTYTAVRKITSSDATNRGFTIDVSDLAGNAMSTRSWTTALGTTPLGSRASSSSFRLASSLPVSSGSAIASILTTTTRARQGVQPAWFDQQPVEQRPTTAADAVSPEAVPVSYTLAKLPVLADISSFSQPVTRSLPVVDPSSTKAAETPAPAPKKAQPASVTPTPAPAPSTAAPVSPTGYSPLIPTPAPSPDTGKQTPRFDWYMEEKRSRASEDEIEMEDEV